MQVYIYIDLMVQELGEIVLICSIPYDHLQIKLNTLSLSYLTTSVIQPFRLAEILKGIESNLPPLLKLLFDKETKNWQYYQYTLCSGVVDDDKIIII